MRIRHLTQRGVEISRTPGVFAHLQAVAPVGVIKLPGFCFKIVPYLTAVIQKVGQPVVVLLVFLDGVLHHPGLDDFVIAGNDALCALDDPRKHRSARSFEQEVRIVLDVCFSLDLGVEGDHNEPPPGTLVNGPLIPTPYS